MDPHPTGAQSGGNSMPTLMCQISLQAHFVISKEKGRMTSSLLKNKMCKISLHASLFGTLEYVDTILLFFHHHLPLRGHFQPRTCTKISIFWPPSCPRPPIFTHYSILLGLPDIFLGSGTLNKSPKYGLFPFWITLTLFFCTLLLQPIFWTFFYRVTNRPMFSKQE